MPEDSSGRFGSIGSRLRARSFGLAMAAIGIGGFLIRAYYVLSVRSRDPFPHGDSVLYYWWPAKQLARGHGYLSPVTLDHCPQKLSLDNWKTLLTMPDHVFSSCMPVQSAKHPPGFVTLLAGLDKLGIQSVDAQKYVMCALGSVTVVLIGVLAARLVNRRAGIIAALIAAVYPNIWITDTSLWSETLMSFGFVLALVGIYGYYKRPSWQPLVVASVGITIATSARSEMLLLYLVVVLPLVLARSTVRFRRRIAMLGVAALIPIAVFTPWTIYNTHRFQKPVPMSTGLGFTALAANCGAVYYTDLIGYFSQDCTKGQLQPAPAGTGPDESQVTGLYRDKAVDYAKAHPGRAVVAVLAREGRLVEVWQPHQMNVLNSFLQGRGSVRLTTFSQRMFWVLALLSIAGAVLWRRRWHIPIYPLMAELGLTALVAAITFGSTRYRAAAEWCLVLLAASAIEAGLAWGIRRYRNRGRAGDPAATAGDTASDANSVGTDEAPRSVIAASRDFSATIGEEDAPR